MTTTGLVTKVCTKCGVDQPLDAYYGKGDGRLNARCKTCMKKVYKAYRDRQTQCDGTLEGFGSMREQYLSGTPRRPGPFVEYVDPKVRWMLDNGLCHVCSTPVDQADWFLDHIQPLAAGGDHSYANTAVAHPKCHAQEVSNA